MAHAVVDLTAQRGEVVFPGGEAAVGVSIGALQRARIACIHLRDVGGVGIADALGNVGHTTLLIGIADRHRIRLVGNCALTERNRTLGADACTLPHGRTRCRLDACVGADRDCVGCIGSDRCVAAERGAALGLDHRAMPDRGVVAVDRHAVVADRQAVATPRWRRSDATTATSGLQRTDPAIESGDHAVERAQRIADVAVVAALDREHTADQTTAGIDDRAAAERSRDRLHPRVHLRAIDRLAARGVDRSGGHVAQSRAVLARQGDAVARIVVVGHRVSGHAFDVADAVLDAVDTAFDHADALVGLEQLVAGHRIGAVGRDVAVGEVGQHRALRAGERHPAAARIVVTDRVVGDFADTRGDRAELVEVDRIRALRTGSEIDQLPFRARSTDRHRVRAIGERAGAERDTAGRGGPRIGAQRQTAVAVGLAAESQRHALHAKGARDLAERGGTVGIGAGAAADRQRANRTGRRAVADRGRMIGRRRRHHADRRRRIPLRAAGDRHRLLAAGVGACADRGRCIFQCARAGAHRGALAAGGDSRERFHLPGFAVHHVILATDRSGAVGRGLRAGTECAGVVGGRCAVEADRGRVLLVGERAAAEGGRAERRGQRARAGRGAVVAHHGRGLLVVRAAGRFEELGVPGRIAQLGEVHRVGALRAGGDVDQLPLRARVTDRDGEVAIGDGIGAERDTARRSRECIGAERHAAFAGHQASKAQRHALRAIGLRRLPECGGAVAERRAAAADCQRAHRTGRRTLADRGRMVGARCRHDTDRRRRIAARTAADRHRLLAGGIGTGADRRRLVRQRACTGAHGHALAARCDGREGFHLPGLAIHHVELAADGGRTVGGGLRAGAERAGVVGRCRAVEADRGRVHRLRHSAAAERRCTGCVRDRARAGGRRECAGGGGTGIAVGLEMRIDTGLRGVVGLGVGARLVGLGRRRCSGGQSRRIRCGLGSLRACLRQDGNKCGNGERQGRTGHEGSSLGGTRWRRNGHSTCVAALCGTPDPWRTAPEKTIPDALPIHYISIFPFAFKGLRRRAAAARAGSATRPG
ncbi:hypothetical protein LUTEI9C_70428 [Luteimonas sp. 9C]|nr:hypothetical protein LUTEI9C_70428 [Luteimonas sp. 9C]